METISEFCLPRLQNQGSDIKGCAKKKHAKPLKNSERRHRNISVEVA